MDKKTRWCTTNEFFYNLAPAVGIEPTTSP